MGRQIPRGATILDVGAGDGMITRGVAKVAGGIALGLEVSARGTADFPLAVFDGVRLPVRSRSVDCLLLVDVLHHASSPWQLLAECTRVTAGSILIKDHLADPPFARARLRFMDAVGNDRFAVASPGTYWTRAQWQSHVSAAGLRIASWDERVDAMPLLLRPFFGWGLHFIARLVPERA
jgi:SAM-dependent methyltransferase